MNAETFEKAVTQRAHERVQERIRAFRVATYKAACDLLGRSFQPYEPNHEGWPEDVRRLLSQLTKPTGNTTAWPAKLWRDEEVAVRKDLFGIMDEMQRALLARPPKPNDSTPEQA
jgi:hypothetical protein